jgi:hypothetical protein
MSFKLKDRNDLTRLLTSISLFCYGVLLSGCVNVLRPYNQPSQEKLRIQSSIVREYTVFVADKIVYQQVSADARVTIDVPRLERGCATYLLGIKVKDSSCYDVPAIHIRNQNSTIRNLSLNQLHKLPLDDQGYHLLKVE